MSSKKEFGDTMKIMLDKFPLEIVNNIINFLPEPLELIKLNVNNKLSKINNEYKVVSKRMCGYDGYGIIYEILCKNGLMCLEYDVAQYRQKDKIDMLNRIKKGWIVIDNILKLESGTVWLQFKIDINIKNKRCSSINNNFNIKILYSKLHIT